MNISPVVLRKRLLQAAMAAALVVVAICFVRLLTARLPAVVEGELIGKAASAVVADFGKPDEDVPRYEPLGTEPQPVPAGAHRTLIYRDHVGGTLYVWLVKREGKWECFNSCWYADGVQF